MSTSTLENLKKSPKWKKILEEETEMICYQPGTFEKNNKNLLKWKN